jgi:uncharacterized protein (TIGR00297 family)
MAGGLAVSGWLAGWLTLGGATTALLVGGAVFIGGGISSVLLLALFFVSGSWLTYHSPRAPHRGRTSWQVLANGGWAAAGAVAINIGWEWGGMLLAGSLAAAQADTWATEIGRSARRDPILITSGRRVPTGTSGGVTRRGTIGGFLGAALMGGASIAVGMSALAGLTITIGGTIGMLGDSLLGATIQAVYRCEGCGREFETRDHDCGGRLRRTRGLDAIRNDVVNFLAAGIGGAVAVALRGWLG